MRYIFPLDPDCPAVRSRRTAMDEDPMNDSIPSDVLEDVESAFQRRHSAECRHCQAYGAENVEVG